MRDLKYLGYFENLLREANNELIVQAKKDGKVCVAFVCENTPEPLINLDGTFSIRLSAPNTGSMDIATYYMTSFLCETSRALLERAIEGGFNFADCLIAPDGCSKINRSYENIKLRNTNRHGNERGRRQRLYQAHRGDGRVRLRGSLLLRVAARAGRHRAQ